MFLFIVLLVIPLSFVAGMFTAAFLNCKRVPRATATHNLPPHHIDCRCRRITSDGPLQIGDDHTTVEPGAWSVPPSWLTDEDRVG